MILLFLIPFGITAALFWRVVWELAAGRLVRWLTFFPADRATRPTAYWIQIVVDALGAVIALVLTVFGTLVAVVAAISN